jgi:hypothetical protein
MFRTALISICLICSAVSAQAPVDHELSIVPDARFLPEVERFSGIALTINRDMVTDILVDDEIQIKNFPLSRVRSVDLALKRFDVFTTDAEVVVASINSHGQIVELSTTRPDVVLLRGFIIDEPESQVFLALGVHTTNGWIESRGSTFVVAKNPKENWTAVYELDAVDPSLMNWIDFKCGVDEVVEFTKDQSADRTHTRGLEINCPALRMAIDTDWQFTGNLFGGNTDASGEYAATLIGAVSTIYESDVDIATKICYLRLWENSNDPWSGGSSSAQLSEFHTYWNSNMGHIDRHLAHMLSAQGLGGGIAYVNAVCTTYGYAVSGNLGGSFPLPIEDHNGNNWDLMVVAHETGHNCGTLHTHDYSPPIDGCGLGDCSEAWGGTIMSYCHTCSGGLSNMVMSFHPIVQDTIVNYLANDISCSLGGDGSPPVAPLDVVWKMPVETIEIDVLANDYANDCTYPQIIDYETSSYFGGIIDMIGDDPTTAVLRYTPPTVEYPVDVFKYYIADVSGQETTGHVKIYTDTPRPADNPTSTEVGTEVQYYSLDNPSSLPDFEGLDPIGTEIVSQVNYPSTGGNFAGSGLSNDVGAVFIGYIEVPTGDTYTLYVESDDGSQLFIGVELVVDNDGLHGMQEESGEIALASGLHAIRVEFFERGGGAGCITRIAGGGMSKQVIPTSMWWHEVAIYGDINGDGHVDIHDLLELIAGWGPCGDPCVADLDGDGTVDINDLLILVGQWT